MVEPVTVTIVNYNGLEYIASCIRAAKALEPSPKEIVVIDNASTDESDRIVESEFPEVRLVRMERNDGPCPARNRGLEESTTRLVYQLDNDVIVSPDSLSKLLCRWHDGVAMIQPRAVFDDDRSLIHYDGAHLHYVGLMTLRHFYGRVEDADSSAQSVDALISLALLVDRDAVLDIGGYDGRYFILFEDHDLSYRLRARGFELWIEPEALVYHRQGTQGISYRKGPDYPRRRAYLHSRNRWLLILKNHGWRTILISLPGLALFETVWVLFAMKQGLLFPYLRGKWSFLMASSEFCRHRIPRSERRVRDRDLLRSESLTFTPLIQRSRWMARAEALLNGCLSVYWRLTKWLVS